MNRFKPSQLVPVGRMDEAYDLLFTENLRLREWIRLSTFMKEQKDTEIAKHCKILALLHDELLHADTKYADDKMSPDELKASFLTLKCEVGELERETERKKIRPKAMEKEAVQCLAMSYKFLRDVIFAED